MIQVYCGMGKGKTCAAMGQALRASGASWRVAVVQFLKDGSSAEITLLKGLPGVDTVLSDGRLAKFTSQMSEAERTASRELHDANLRRALEAVGCAGEAACEAGGLGGAGDAARTDAAGELGDAAGACGAGPTCGGVCAGEAAQDCGAADAGEGACGRLLVLDEVLDALRAGLLDEGLLRRALAWAAGQQTCELVVTGHWLPDFVADAADYLTRFECDRHPYARGVTARAGIEY